MTEQERAEMMDTVNQVFHLSSKSFLYGGIYANNNMVYQARAKAIDSLGWAQWDVDLIFKDILRLIEARSVVQNQRYVDVFRAVFSGDAKAKAGSTANQDLLLTELINRGLPLTEENLSEVVSAVWDSLDDSPQAAAENASQRLRARRIAEMVGDPPTHGFSVQIGPRRYAFDKFGRTYDYQQGMTQGQGSLAARGPWSAGQGGFDSMSDDEVENIWNLWRTSQDLKSMSKEQLREIVRKGGHSDAFGNHQSLRLPSAGAPGDEGELINPATGREFTQRELIKHINDPNDPFAGRKLITHTSSGRVVAAKRQRFEEIIKGLRG